MLLGLCNRTAGLRQVTVELRSCKSCLVQVRRAAAMSSKQQPAGSQPLGAMPPGGMSALCRHARSFLEHGIEQVLPNALVTKAVQREGDALRVNNQLVPLAHNAYLVGFGKAVGGMANVMQTLLADHLIEGIISVPQGTRQIAANMNRPEMLPDPSGPVKVLEGAKDNMPDDRAVAAAAAIVALMQRLKDTDILIVLISGGGSALLTYPVPPLTLKDINRTTQLLQSSGARITEINAIRKRISAVKGGGLLRQTTAPMLSLILSDVAYQGAQHGATVCVDFRLSASVGEGGTFMGSGSTPSGETAQHNTALGSAPALSAVVTASGTDDDALEAGVAP